jgi:decaprenylphospho-beta-D-erythro-pentofuranosid-2-ulose 2-reductase
MKYVLIIGAKGSIAKETAKLYAKKGYNLYLAARNVNDLKDFALNLKTTSGQEIRLVEFDVLKKKNHRSIYENLTEKPFGVICCSGYLGNQIIAQNDSSETEKIIDTNFSGVVNILNIISNDFEKKRSGFIVAISSVAGDRGRKRNYIYGSSKAALSEYLSGLRNRLYKSNINVITIKPGFVYTKMTSHMNLPKILTAKPIDVANDIYNAQLRNQNVIYTKSIWRIIMSIIKIIPETVFKRMNF